MAKKVKKTKITETLVTQLQEVKEEPVNTIEENPKKEEETTAIPEEEPKTPEVKEESEVTVEEKPKTLPKKSISRALHVRKSVNTPKKVSRSIQRAKTYSTQVPQHQDSETTGISLGLGSVL